MKTASKGKTRRGITLAPFFPGYLFVKVCLEVDRWQTIDSTIGVSKLVRFGALPTPLPPGLLEDLQRSSDGRGVLGFQDTLQEGDRITIVGGAFNAVRGIYEANTDAARVQVLLDMMSRQVRISVPRSEVMATGQSQ
jgi:transcriptional antiterminator RfaH